MIEDPTLHGFVARLRTKSELEGLTHFERKYLEAAERRARREGDKGR